MPEIIWTNHAFQPDAAALLAQELRRLDCQLIESKASSGHVLKPGEPDASIRAASIAYGQPAPADILAHPGLKWAALSSAGYTRYDNDAFRDAMRARGTCVTNASAVFAGPCAEHAFAMMLAFTRQLPKNVLNGAGPREWNYYEGRFSIRTLHGATVLILGYGSIGRCLLELLRPFNCNIIGHRRKPRGDEGIEIVTNETLPAALARADHVVSCLPDSPETTRFCDDAFFSAMRPDAYFVNIGRGSTVDQPALARTLRDGGIAGAFLDALDPEPLPPDHELWAVPNCHITPHLAGGHPGQDHSLVRHFIANLEGWRAGAPLQDRII